jgi:hypothetical protein
VPDERLPTPVDLVVVPVGGGLDRLREKAAF